jgi:hypothetical protein
MPLYKFGAGDVFYNQLRTYPSSSFYIYSGSVYYQNKSTEVGSIVANVNGVPVGNISLFELNVDRAATSTGRIIGLSSSVGTQNVVDNGTIYPFIEKGLSKVGFKGLTRKQFINDYAQGDVITGSYFMSSSITRKLYGSAAGFNDTNKDGAALRNSLDFAKRLGSHYNFPSGSSATFTNVIYIPSIFYGSEIKKGTVDLKFYITGTLVAHCRDSRYDGALIMQGDGDSTHSTRATDGLTVGCVLYNEGAIILTSSARISDLASSPNVKAYSNRTNTTTSDAGGKYTWEHFGLGLPQGNDTSLERLTTQAFLQSASFGLDFAGTHKIPTVTMLANANRGELNYTNNPTYIEFGQTAYNPVTSSTFFGEQQLNIKNIHSSSYSDPTGSLKKTTYITKIGIYDDKKKLIGVASVAKPVKKTEDRDLTFKLKLDI